MGFKSDIEIAQEAKMKEIREIADSLGIPEDYVENYGRYKAKIDYRYYKGNLVDFVKENGVQDVIFVNNADVLNTSKPKQIQALLGA